MSVRKDKRDKEAAEKSAVFGVLKHDGNVYAQIILDTKADNLNVHPSPGNTANVGPLESL